MTVTQYRLAPYPEQRGADARLLFDELRHSIEALVAGQERSQQVRIGPSEVGMPCDRCLGHKLAGVPELPEVDWLPFVGTCVHKMLADHFTHLAAIDPLGVRWLIEQTVDVGEIDGVSITGHADLFDRCTATVIDWKCVGVTTLRKAKKGPSQTYRAQAHLYARGFVRRGLEVDRVAIYYLPRNASSLAQGIPWSEPYNEQIALDALTRADALARAIRVAGWLNVRPGLAAHPDCPQCHRYPLPNGQRMPRPGRTPDKFTDLTGAAA